jgi:hypothetical protein
MIEPTDVLAIYTITNRQMILQNMELAEKWLVAYHCIVFGRLRGWLS